MARRGAASPHQVAVTVTRGVGTITATVPLTEAFTVLVELLEGMRTAVARYPELLDAGPDVVPGGDPVPVVEDWCEGDRRRRRGVGFHP